DDGCLITLPAYPPGRGASLPHAAGDAEEILSQDPADRRVVEAPVEERLGQARPRLRVDIPRAAIRVLALRPVGAIALERRAPRLRHEPAVHPEADVLGADQLDHVVDVLDQVLDHRTTGAEEAPAPGDRDPPAGGRARLDLVVPDVSLVVAQVPGIRVR